MWLDAGQAVVAHELHEVGDPVDQFLDVARDVAARGVRAQHHQHVGKALGHHAEQRSGRAHPVVLEPPPARPDDVDAVVGAGDAVEAGGVDQDVEGEVLGAGPDALGRDALDRRLVDVDQAHVVLIVDLEIAGLERQPARAEAVVLGDQLVGDLGIAHPLADLLGHEGARKLIGLLVGQNVGEVADPDAEARLAVELLPERLALLGRNLQRLARIGLVDEAGAGLPAALEDLGVGGLDLLLLLRGDAPVVQRRRPVGRALEHREMADLGGDGLDRPGWRSPRCR